MQYYNFKVLVVTVLLNFIQVKYTDKMVFSGIQIQWFADDPDITHGAAGRRDVLHIVSAPSTTSPDIVPRRSRGPLTETEKRKLEKQGIHRDCQHTDLSIMTAREGLHGQTIC